MRLAFVVQRYGPEVVGGAEYLARMLAERLAKRHAMTVLTTTAKEFRTWENELPAGEHDVNGVRVVRFPNVTTRLRAVEAIAKPLGRISGRAGRAWIRSQGPWSPALVRHLRDHHRDFDAIFFFTYLYYPTARGIFAVPRAGIVTTAHDEPMFHMPHVRDVLARAKALLFLTPEERKLVERRLGGFGDRHVCLLEAGIDVPTVPLASLPASDVGAPFVLYVGRKKRGVDELPRMWRAFRDLARGTRIEANDGTRVDVSRAKLVLVGDAAHPHVPEIGVERLGPVDETRKWSLLRDAMVIVQPSYNESFSLVLPEAWEAGRPCLANARCECLDGQIRRSGGGLVFRDDASFASAMAALLGSRAKRDALAASGRAYGAEHFAWDAVLARFETCAAVLAGEGLQARART